MTLSFGFNFQKKKKQYNDKWTTVTTNTAWTNCEVHLESEAGHIILFFCLVQHHTMKAYGGVDV
jgi:hypothetical protein